MLNEKECRIYKLHIFPCLLSIKKICKTITSNNKNNVYLLVTIQKKTLTKSNLKINIIQSVPGAVLFPGRGRLGSKFVPINKQFGSLRKLHAFIILGKLKSISCPTITAATSGLIAMCSSTVVPGV